MRFVWKLIGLAVVVAVVAGVSWMLAYNTVDDVLGDPPPQMGDQKTTFLWYGMPRTKDHPRVWRFAFGPTLIPGAPRVTIFVSPLGKLVRLEPADLDARLKIMRGKGYN